MNERDEKILDHIGRYRVSLRRVIAQHFFNGGNCGNVLQQLLESKRIVSHAGLGGPLRYYQLTLGEARHRGLPQDRGRRLGPRALETHLTLLWFCCVEQTPRQRLEANELERLFGMRPAGPQHVADPGPPQVIRRVQLVSTRVRPADILKRLRSDVGIALANPALADWVQGRRYGFTLLMNSAASVSRVRERVRRDPIATTARIDIRYVPSPTSMPQELRACQPLPKT